MLPSSGIYRRVVRVWTDVSEKCRIRTFSTLYNWHLILASHLLHAGFLNIALIRSSETSVHIRTTQCYIPEDGKIHTAISFRSWNALSHMWMTLCSKFKFKINHWFLLTSFHMGLHYVLTSSVSCRPWSAWRNYFCKMTVSVTAWPYCKAKRYGLRPYHFPLWC
jgi:hypothetical protein